MLADKDAAVFDECFRSGFLRRFVIPAAGVTDFHGHRGADGLCAEIEGGVAGDDFRIGERADIAHLRPFRGDFARFDHLVELVARDDTGEITTFINGGKTVVIVLDTVGVRLGAGGVCKLDLGEFPRRSDDVILMTEAVRENDVAALIHKVDCRIIACRTLGDTGLDDDSDLLLLRKVSCGVDEVLVIGAVLVMQADHTERDVGILGPEDERSVTLVARGKTYRDRHDKCQNERERHNFFLHKNLRILCLSAFYCFLNTMVPSSDILSMTARDFTS